jgi:hypothetical protein
VRRLKAPHAIHPVYMRASRNPKVVELLTDLWGSLRYDSGKLNMKSAGYGAPIEWHQDWAFYPHTNEDLAAVGIMIALRVRFSPSRRGAARLPSISWPGWCAGNAAASSDVSWRRSWPSWMLLRTR